LATELGPGLTRAHGAESIGALRGPRPQIPAPVEDLLATLRRGGQAAYVVGGCLRDALLGREPADWDLTTDARPERVQALFPRSIYENRFGTVVVRHDEAQYEITAFGGTPRTPTFAIPTQWSSATRSSRTWPDATSP
jgi:hypothetical protein